MVRQLLILLAACGGSSGGNDASPDAAPATGTIRVRASAGTHVLFRGPDGAVQDIVAASDGFASAMSGANTAATVLASSTILYGYEGLNPGDTVDTSVVTPPETQRLKPDPTVTLPRFEDAVAYDLKGSSGAIGMLHDQSAATTISGIFTANDTAKKTDATLVATTQAPGSGTFAYSVVTHADLTKPVTLPAFQPTPMATLTANGFPLPVRQSSLSVSRYDKADPSSMLTAQGFYPDGTGTYKGVMPPVGDSSITSGYFKFDSDREVDYYAADELNVDGAAMPHLGIGAMWNGDKATWMESAEGVDPLLSYIVMNAGGAQLLIVAPYTGPAVELPPLPATVDTSGAFVAIAATYGFAPGTKYIDAIAQQVGARWTVRILQ